MAVKIQIAHGKRPERFSVIGVRDGGKPGFPRMAGLLMIMKTHFQRCFHRRRAVIGKENFIEV